MNWNITEHDKSHQLIYHRDIIKDVNYNENLENLNINIKIVKNKINEIITMMFILYY